MRLQPITYCLVMNIVILAITAWLADKFASPLLIIVAIFLCNHALQRFDDDTGEDDERDEPDEYEGGRAGFTGDVSKR